LLPKFFTVPRLYQDQCRASDVIIARSRYDRERLVRSLGADPARVEIVLNGIDPPSEADPALARRRFNLPEEFALHASQYATPNKNAVRMCEAIGPTGRPFILVGQAQPGAILDRLRSLAERYSNIMLLGFMERPVLDSLFAGCRVLCLPSMHEGTGLVALEGAVRGAEVVITRRGGPPDYFLNWGHYCEPTDVRSIREAFVSAWNTPRRSELRDHILNNLTWDHSGASLSRALEKHRPRAE
jgi:glycosyltransferase involved in cell wall biosynthesis